MRHTKDGIPLNKNQMTMNDVLGFVLSSTQKSKCAQRNDKFGKDPHVTIINQNNTKFKITVAKCDTRSRYSTQSWNKKLAKRQVILVLFLQNSRSIVRNVSHLYSLNEEDGRLSEVFFLWPFSPLWPQLSNIYFELLESLHFLLEALNSNLKNGVMIPTNSLMLIYLLVIIRQLLMCNYPGDCCT